MPCTGLGDSNIPVQFHAGHTFETGGFQEDRPCPFLERDFTALQCGSRLNGEVPFAIPAPVRHLVGVPADLVGVGAPASWAGAPILPDHGFKPLQCGFLIREPLCKFN